MADLAIVKLKPAKKYLRDYYLISEDTPAFQENDIMMGIKYLRVIADRFRRPLVTLLGLGTNYGSHTGYLPLKPGNAELWRLFRDRHCNRSRK